MERVKKDNFVELVEKLSGFLVLISFLYRATGFVVVFFLLVPISKTVLSPNSGLVLIFQPFLLQLSIV
jgi:hypothetical protein